ncbi:MAG: GNAT family N-acetyltransferase [Oscillospiraceae bacterium]|nr:GNAT family N-acetyltransferase [Oscillospiraceae bacterium]
MITKINDSNIKEAAKVYMLSWIESHKEICSNEFIERHSLSYMIEFLKDKIKLGYDLFICYDNKNPVGMVGINPADEEICLLYVLPEEQGKGFGSKLLEYALSKCRNPYITVLDTNKKAIDFYLKRGFVSAEEQEQLSEEKRIFERKYVYQNRNM